MTLRAAALDYAARGWPVFPANSRRQPLLKDWPNTASTDPEQIAASWTQLPYALIGMPTGARSGIVVLDIDRKNGKDGVRTLARLGYAELPATPTVLTAHGGFHLHFQRPEGGLRNTVGAGGRGIGDGLDWRGDGGYVVLPAPDSGYRWGELHYGNCALRLPPEDLLPRQAEAPHLSSATPTTTGLAGALRRLHAASPGERNNLLFWTACRFAEAVEAEVIGEDGATTLLRQGGEAIGLRDREITATIKSAFGGRA
jgi:hypothetical protein